MSEMKKSKMSLINFSDKELIELIQQTIRQKKELAKIRVITTPCDIRHLPESEKIPLRVAQAEIMALEYALDGLDLEDTLVGLIDKEYYCACEGFKKAIEYLKHLSLTSLPKSKSWLSFWSL